MPCPNRACAVEGRLFGDNQPSYLDLFACYEAYLVDAGGEAKPHLVRATREGVLSHEATRDIQHLDAIGIHRRGYDGEGPRVGIREDAEGARIRPQAGSYVEVDGVPRRTAGSRSSYRFQDDGVPTNADVIDSEGGTCAGGRRTRRRDVVVPLPGVGVTGLRGSRIEGYIASCGDGEGLTTDDSIAGISDLGPSGVLHDDGYGRGGDGVRGGSTAWLAIGIEDSDGGYTEGAFSVRGDCVCSAGGSRDGIAVGIQPLIGRGTGGRRIERDRGRVYTYRPGGSPIDGDGAGSDLVARDVYRKGTRGRLVAFHDEVERMPLHEE
jgi:hypothetical protein